MFWILSETLRFYLSKSIQVIDETQFDVLLSLKNVLVINSYLVTQIWFTV